jgi:hypothetical protein
LRILSIDQGEVHFGICLAEHDGRLVRPLFLGTAFLDPKPLQEMVEPRAMRRRIRRTAREHRRRLKRLRDLLGARGGPLHGRPDLVGAIAAFANRRGHFYAEGENEEAEAAPGDAIPHQQFLTALDGFLTGLLSDPSVRASVARVCISVLSRKNRRPMRVNARQVGVCQWEGCMSRRAKVGVGSLVQGLAGKLRPFLEQGALTPQSVLDLARTALEDAGTGPAALMRRLEASLVAGFGLGERPDAKGKPLPPEKALSAALDELAVAVPGESGADRAKRWQRAKLLARWVRPKRKEAIKAGVRRDLESARKALTEDAPGHSRFCPSHQQAYVATFLRGEQAPLRQDSQEVSRRLAILADKLASYLSRRVLGDPPRRVDLLVVESSAFDALQMLRQRAGPPTDGARPARPAMSTREEARLYELYWNGPRAAFDGDTKAMLRAEFGDLCAYCGQPLGTNLEEDHVLPRSRFPMEGYLVRVPVHPACNREKDTRSLLAWGRGIQSEALAAFTKYVDKTKSAKGGAIHPILEVKKGLLQNLTWDRLQERLSRAKGDLERAERSLQEMAGSWMIQTTATARHGRFLRAALAKRLGIPPEKLRTIAPRHAALLRARLTEAWDYDKPAAKRAGDRVDNHALDAYVLALGTATNFFARLAMAERFSRDTEDCLAEAVASADPTFRAQHHFNLDLLPVPGAEGKTDGFGAVGGDRSPQGGDTATGVRLVSTTPPGTCRSPFDTTLYALAGPSRDEPACRMPVAEFWDRLRKADDKGPEVIARVTHRVLRERLQAAWAAGGLEAAGRALVQWYKTTSQGFDKPGPGVAHTSHPTIQARWGRIRAFLANPEARVEDIPGEFSVRLLQEGRSKAATPLLRGRHRHHRLSSGGVVAKVVGYRASGDGLPDRTRPIVLSIQPDWSIAWEAKGRYRDLPGLPPALTDILVHDGTPFAPRIRQKQAALDIWFSAAGCPERYWVGAGNTIRRADGAREFVPNHKDAPPSRYRGIVAVGRGLPRA